MYNFERINKRTAEVEAAREALKEAEYKMTKANEKANEAKEHILTVLVTDAATSYVIGLVTTMMRHTVGIMPVIGSYVNLYLRNEINDIMFSTQMSVDIASHFISLKDKDEEAKQSIEDVCDFIDELTTLTMIHEQDRINDINHAKLKYIRDVLTNIMMWIG